MSHQVELTGRAGLKYSENGMFIFVDSELLAKGEYDIVVYADSIRQWLRGSDIVGNVGEGDVERVRLNIAEGLKPLRVDWQ